MEHHGGKNFRVKDMKLKNKYVYTVWLRDLTTTDDDPDHEWPACFLIIGKNQQAAKKWGDYLSKKYAKTTNNMYMKSEIESFETSTLPGLDTIPLIYEGEEVDDEKIDW